jgi:hypothetical protein
MNKISKILLLVVGFGLLAVAVGFLTSTPAPAAPTSRPVTVVNTRSNPVPTWDHSPTQPFRIGLCVDTGTQAALCTGRYPNLPKTANVPTTTTDGHTVERMVIENITGSCESFGQQVFELSLTTTLNENFSPVNTLPHVIPVTASASPAVQTVFQQTRLYADPGSLLVLGLGITGSPNPNVGSVCPVLLTGYLTTTTP